jgi:hypothetical protein
MFTKIFTAKIESDLEPVQYLTAKIHKQKTPPFLIFSEKIKNGGVFCCLLGQI